MPEATAGNLETLADNALSFVKARPQFFPRRRSSLVRGSLFGIQFEIDFHVVVIALD
jgi:hypothetical protein